MPSEMVDRKSLPSSSFFSEEARFPNEQRQVGFWKTEIKAESYGANPVGSPTVESQMVKNSKLNDSNFIRNQKVSGSLEKHAVGAERAASNSLGRSFDRGSGTRATLNLDPTFYPKGAGDGISFMGAQYENSLFSSSLSDLFSRKLRLASDHAPVGHSVGAGASNYEEDDSLETLKEIEAKTIGNLLPSDDDLLSGVTDGFDYLAQSNTKEDVDDFDLFSSVGGLDLGEIDGFSGQQDSDFSSINMLVSESRTLFVRNINSNVEDSELRTLFELYGDIRTLYTACKHRGFVMISYYDIRAARNALRALQNKPLKRRKLDIHFSIPKDNPSEQDINQGILVVFNLDPSVSNEELRHIFTAYGEIKDIRDAMQGSHQKIVEFYDVRAAEAALRALNRSEIAGKQIKIEKGCSSGTKWSGTGSFPSEMEQHDSVLNLQHIRSPTNSTPGFFGPMSHGEMMTPSGMSNGSITQVPSNPFMGGNVYHHGISSSVPNNLPSLLRVESLGTSTSALPGHSHSQSQQYSLGHQATPSFHRVGSNAHPHDLNDSVFGPSGNGGFSPGHHHYMWNAASQRPQGMMWPNSPSFVNGVPTATAHPPPRMRAIIPGGAPSSHMLNNTLLPLNNHNVGSAPSVNLWDRRHSYNTMGESPDTSGFHPGSLGRNSPHHHHHHADFLSPNMFPPHNFVDMAKNNMSLHQRCMMLPGGRGQMIPMLSSSFDSPNERSRSRRNEGNNSSSQGGDNKKQFELDLDRIMRGDDKRTTLMIKNIPNKYTSKMLLAAIDERHRGTYDFIYLPIDFKNKCNVGYAFINMIDPAMIVPFYQVFNGKKWEKFNSEKVATLTYARIQGKSALIAHFQNSSLMNEDKRCRPILFNTDGPNAGDQVPFPMGVNVRPRISKNRASTSDENYQDGGTYTCTGEELTFEDSTSTKDSD